MSRKRALACALICLSLAGCSSKGLEPSPLPKFRPSVDARVDWRATTGIARGYMFSPVSFKGMVCAAGGDGRLSCFDAERGARVWVSRPGVAASGGVGTGENMLLIGTNQGEVIAYEANGNVLWRSRVSSEVLSSPVAAGSTVVVRSGDSQVFGLDARDGRQLWVYQSPPQSLILRATPGIVMVDENAMISGFPGGRLTKLDTRDGSLLWDIAVATPRGNNELERMTDVAGTPLIEGEAVCAVAFQGRIGCFDTEKGEQIWARSASSAGSIVADGQNVYYTEADGTVVAYDKVSGASVWRQEKLLYRRVSSPVLIGEWLVVGDFEGYLHVLSPSDGAFVGRVATDGSAIVTSPLRVGERVVVQTERGGLFAIGFRPRS